MNPERETEKMRRAPSRVTRLRGFARHPVFTRMIATDGGLDPWGPSPGWAVTCPDPACASMVAAVDDRDDRDDGDTGRYVRYVYFQSSGMLRESAPREFPTYEAAMAGLALLGLVCDACGRPVPLAGPLFIGDDT